MNTWLSLWAALLASQLVFVAQTRPTETQTGGEQQKQELNGSELKRRLEFYQRTAFQLEEPQTRLLGPLFATVDKTTVHLPSWFDFEHFKKVFKKSYKTPEEEARRHEVFIKSCVRALKARVLYRILAGTRDTLITKDADQFYEESIPYLSHQSVANNADLENNEMVSALQLDDDREAVSEEPLAKAVRLVREELAQVESRNQLENYLKAFEGKRKSLSSSLSLSRLLIHVDFFPTNWNDKKPSLNHLPITMKEKDGSAYPNL